MIRCANTGVSGIISATGTHTDPVTGDLQLIQDENGSHFTRGTLYGHAYPPVHGPVSLYALAGDWFAWLMIALVIFLVIRSRLTRA